MIHVTALYPNTPGSRFDHAYYLSTHTALAQRLLEQHGLRALRTTVGVSSLGGGAPPFWTISELVFDTREAFDRAMEHCGSELFADVPNYTNSTPIMQISDLRGE